jgi:signal transduction histidine kinase
MGLAIAKGIIEAHNGRIWIESGNDNKGTSVLFTLPIGDQDLQTEIST